MQNFASRYDWIPARFLSSTNTKSSSQPQLLKKYTGFCNRACRDQNMHIFCFCIHIFYDDIVINFWIKKAICNNLQVALKFVFLISTITFLHKPVLHRHTALPSRFSVPLQLGTSVQYASCGHADHVHKGMWRPKALS